MENTNPSPAPAQDRDLKHLEALSKLMDNQFVLPGTSFRFGFDGLLGLIPGVGDLIGLFVSGLLLRTMLRKGAGPILMLRMMGNVLLDAITGVVPFVGDLFDFGFKANRRNVEMLKKYYAENPEPPDAKRSIALIGLLFFVLFLLAIYGVWRLIRMAWAWF